MEEATFGAGCFWHIEKAFDELQGVETEAGYMGGDKKKFPSPKYEQICGGKTGYIEVVHLKFNPKKISYAKLLDLFWRIHNPTSFDKQEADIGSQYRSVIFYHDLEQKKIAEKSKKEFEKKIKGKIVTEIRKAGKFFRAEEYHQKYYKKNKIICKIENIFTK